jgi:hypothetical protein
MTEEILEAFKHQKNTIDSMLTVIENIEEMIKKEKIKNEEFLLKKCDENCSYNTDATFMKWTYNNILEERKCCISRWDRGNDLCENCEKISNEFQKNEMYKYID